MAIHAREEEIRSLRQLSLLNLPVTKATTVGIVIDCTSAFLDQRKGCFTRKMNLIDPQYNVQFFSPYDKGTYITVFIHHDFSSKLPCPKAVGDIIYLKRFKIARYNGQLQAFSYAASFCSWTLFDGSAHCQALGAYATSKEHLQFKEDQLQDLRFKIKELRNFSHRFFQKFSVLSLHPNGFNSKDMDLVVKVLGIRQQGYTLTDGVRKIVLKGISAQVKEGDICKLRSVVRLDKGEDGLLVVNNKYTSLLTIREDSYDAQWFHRKHQSFKSQQVVNIYTSLKDLQSLPYGECNAKQFNVKVEVLDISPSTFGQALHYYHKNTGIMIKERPSQVMYQQMGYFKPLYKLTMVCSDHQNLESMSDLFVYSYDNKCADLLPRVNLEEDMNEFSSLVQEDYFFQEKKEELLNAEYVGMVVEVLFNLDTGERALRVLKIIEIA